MWLVRGFLREGKVRAEGEKRTEAAPECDTVHHLGQLIARRRTVELVVFSEGFGGGASPVGAEMVVWRVVLLATPGS